MPFPILKSYDDEDGLYPDMLERTCTREQAVATVNALSVARWLPSIPVVFHDTKPGKQAVSSYQPFEPKEPGHRAKTEEIDFDTSMLNYLTVAHEWAHYAHYTDYMRRRSLHEHLSMEKFPVERWHGPKHRKLVEDAVALIRGWLAEADALTAATEPGILADSIHAN